MFQLHPLRIFSFGDGGMIVSDNKSSLTKLTLERTMDYHREILVIILAAIAVLMKFMHQY